MVEDSRDRARIGVIGTGWWATHAHLPSLTQYPYAQLTAIADSDEMAWVDIDANLLAIELDDFRGAILSGRQPEVSGGDGLRSLAVIYGFLESERLGRMVDVNELLSGKLGLYQGELEAVGQEMRA